MWIKSSILVVLLMATQSYGQSGTPTEPTYFTEVCDPLYGNYTASSTYSTNLQTVISTLETQSSISLFSNATAGSGSGKVYGQYYCRGDVDSTLCSACISQASAAVLTNCSNFKSAVIWYDICTLRYHNESMFGVLSTNNVGYGWSIANVSDPDSFSSNLNATLAILIDEAAHGNDSRRFAVGDTPVSTFEMTYFLVQCSPDLSDVECDTCLWETYGHINRCCGNWPVRARVFFPSCQMRYGDSIFYTGPPSPPPPPLEFSPTPPPTDFLLSPPPPSDSLSSPPPPSDSLSSPPPPPYQPVPTVSSMERTSKASSEKVKVVLAVICLAYLTLQL